MMTLMTAKSRYVQKKNDNGKILFSYKEKCNIAHDDGCMVCAERFVCEYVCYGVCAFLCIA